MTVFSLFPYHHWGKYREDFWSVKLRGTLLGLIALLFTFLTFRPPHIPLFRDPRTGTYGLS